MNGFRKTMKRRKKTHTKRRSTFLEYLLKIYSKNWTKMHALNGALNLKQKSRSTFCIYSFQTAIDAIYPVKCLTLAGSVWNSFRFEAKAMIRTILNNNFAEYAYVVLVVGKLRCAQNIIRLIQHPTHNQMEWHKSFTQNPNANDRMKKKMTEHSNAI